MVKTLYSLDEVVLIPATISDINSRSECIPYYKEKLPLYIAAMSCLIDKENVEQFEGFGFNVIVPRTVDWEDRRSSLEAGEWVAVSLEEGKKILDFSTILKDAKIKVSIDIANGHQLRALRLCRDLRKAFPHAEIMIGNVANPWTYLAYARAGADYIRVGIGSGQVCTTSVQTGTHYPMASLIFRCNLLRKWFGWIFKKAPKIIADGGFGYIDQIVKALALGADYVMIGKIAASFPEACGKIVDGKREYYGMSTEKAQRLMHPEPDYVPKHTEGTVRYVEIRESTQEWVDDFTHALRSSMSYQGAKTLKEFVGRVKWGIQNPTTFNAYIKS